MRLTHIVIVIFQLATRMRMGVMKDCDDGDWKWMEDVNAEGGLEFNTQCAQVEATKVSFNSSVGRLVGR